MNHEMTNHICSFGVMVICWFCLLSCRCSKCGRDSEASSKMEDFYALELNVKGLKSLDASLNDYLSLEQLNGDNQYFCGSCNARVDATRCIKLRTLPPVITFQLKRCIFLPKVVSSILICWCCGSWNKRI